jgi:hypothetical protein
MLSYLKGNGFPMTIICETSEYEDKENEFKGYKTIFTDENGKVIGDLIHKNWHDRVHWVGGFFKGLELKNGT